LRILFESMSQEKETALQHIRNLIRNGEWKYENGVYKCGIIKINIGGLPSILINDEPASFLDANERTYLCFLFEEKVLESKAQLQIKEINEYYGKH